MAETAPAMSATGAVLALAALMLLAIVGSVAGILIERQRAPSHSAWRNPAVRDALLAVAGWLSLVALYALLVAFGADDLPTTLKHLLATLALIFYIYAVLATFRLIYRSARRIVSRIRTPEAPFAFRPLPILGRLRFPTLFASVLLAAIAVFWHDGVSTNFAFATIVLALLAAIRPQPPSKII